MNTQRQELIHFVQNAKGLDNHAKLKLILVAAGAKPATFFALRINPKNLDEKPHLEKHLKASKLLFTVSKPKAYEEIVGITDNAVRWKITGTWYGYDVFNNKKSPQHFATYVRLVKHQLHEQADRISGKLYDYPRCCVERYIKEHRLDFLRKNYTQYTYYKRLHDTERAFPLIMHTACSVRCAASKKMHARYATVLKNSAAKFWKRFSSVKKHTVNVVCDTESELLQDTVYGIRSTTPVFPVKDGHEYSLLTLKPIERQYYLISYLTKQRFARGTVFPAIITIRYHYADVVLQKPKRVIHDLHHERHFVLL